MRETEAPPHPRVLNILSIAGSDPSGGAGIQADLKTFAALDCYGMAALTAVTVQNTQGVRDVLTIPPDVIAAQIQAVFDDIRVDAVKIGMIGTVAAAEAIAAVLAPYPDLPVVVDPVLAATSGDALGSNGVGAAILRHLAPGAALLTPNLGEAASLAECTLPHSVADMGRVGNVLRDRGATAVLVKGGHLDGADAPDVLCSAAGVEVITGRRIATRNTHGTGCTLSSAIAVFLARGRRLPDAVTHAKTYVEGALKGAGRLHVGRGHGPLDHLGAFGD